MMTSLWLAMAFIGAFAVVVGINLAISQFLEEREKARRLRVEQESRRRQAARARQSMANRDVYEMAVEGLIDPEDLGSPLERFRRFVGQSGLDVTAEQIVLIASFGALILGGGLGYLRKSVSLGVFVGLLVSVLPMAFVAIARELKLDLQRFDADRRGTEVAEALARDLVEAELARIDGTPTFFVDGELVPFEDLETALTAPRVE